MQRMHICIDVKQIPWCWQLRSYLLQAPYKLPIPFPVHRPCNLSEPLLFPHYLLLLHH